MVMRLHPDSERLRERMGKCLRLAQTWEETIYRVTTIDYANRRDLLWSAVISSPLSLAAERLFSVLGQRLRR
jgi:hypothetical protein